MTWKKLAEKINEMPQDEQERDAEIRIYCNQVPGWSSCLILDVKTPERNEAHLTCENVDLEMKIR